LEHSQFEKEFKPTAKGKLAVLRVGELVDFTKDGKTTGFVCKHMPREKNGPKFGEQYDFRTAGFDPHSGIFTLPLEGAELLAVQQYLISKIIYSEPGK